jgi:hypothetical protein
MTPAGVRGINDSIRLGDARSEANPESAVTRECFALLVMTSAMYAGPNASNSGPVLANGGAKALPQSGISGPVCESKSGRGEASAGLLKR